MKKYTALILPLLLCSPLLAEAKQGNSGNYNAAMSKKADKNSREQRDKREAWTSASNVFIDMRGTMFWIKADDAKKR